MPLPELPELQYGEHFNQAVRQRLEDHFAAAVAGTGMAASRALVVGLMGEWGSGKTLHLRHIRQDFEDRLRPHFSGDQSQEKALTVPVFFNAWRFEAEEHLIIPLLKTTQQRLRRLADEQEEYERDNVGTPDRIKSKVTKKDWIKAKAKYLGDAASALAYGLKGQLNLPGASSNFPLAQIEFDPAKAMDEYRRRRQAQQEFIDGLSSLYFDFETWINGLTAPDGDDGERLNLLFLIDDLDRCLPEKAVRMLESIKLFLDVRGCAFVLALDDEVVERGIAWRYRDYGPGQGQKDRPANPVTGHEYLEKIVQVPIRIPAPAERQIENYLIAHFGPLFGPLEASREERNQDPKGEGTDDAEESAGESTRKDSTENEPRRLLRNLIRRAVPPVPRKLNRVGELYGLCLDAAREIGWIMDRTERLTLLRLTILQLLAPDLYRFGRRNPVFLAKLEDWKPQAPGTNLDLDQVEAGIRAKIEANEKQLEKNPKDPNAAGDLYNLKYLDQPLLALVRSARRQRSSFDPLNLVDPEHLSAERLERFFRLDMTQAQVSAGPDTASPIWEPRPTDGLDDLGGFLSQLFSTDPLAWRNALEQEASNLEGRVLDQAGFEALLERVRVAPEFIEMDWVELIAPHLSADQLFGLYKESRLLTRLAQELTQT